MNVKKLNGTSWVTTPSYIYKSATEIITSPTTIYCNGSNATISLKGNTTQSGTPSPSSPVPVLGVGDLVDGNYQIPILNDSATMPVNLGSTTSTRKIKRFTPIIFPSI